MRRSLVAFGVSVLLLLVALLALDPAALVGELAGADPRVFALGLLAIILALVCWSEGFRVLLVASGGPVSSRRAFLAYGTAMFGKQVLPMGHAGGPALMAYTFDREAALGYDRTLAVVTVAEFLNLAASVALAVLGVAYLLLFAPAVPEVRVLQVGVLAFAAAIVLLASLFWYRRGTVERGVVAAAGLLRSTLGGLSGRLEAALTPERVGAGLDRYYGTVATVAADRRAVLVAYLLMQAGWILFTVPLYTGALAVGIRLPVALVLFLVPASGIATVVPLPGALGGFEIVLGAMLVALTGLELASVAAVVVLYRLCSYWFMVLVGGASSAYSATTVRELAADGVAEGE